ncbi:RNA chaperone Hfq [Candidatus Hydrogenosomobacter endosymbioticus]|uniref:RNA-binding protein Hfq n=1 Tax=Candidatus Hydrogenosomobacter endosymbioticus TaxID=2558174 RepID=A0ABN6L8L2_9PROT|nr:RNA chaperone Hfq [Candidatus Hydrogenosomobacter endosymbioticus]BDB96465.1 RNA-binding protein Hfq [Candidatus Hydrogenosomobacter endosymbioticus]
MEKNVLQDAFLNGVRKKKVNVTVFLINGVKLSGIITWFDNFSVLLKRDGSIQFIYKHAISTISPEAPFSMYDVPEDGGSEKTSRDEVDA